MCLVKTPSVFPGRGCGVRGRFVGTCARRLFFKVGLVCYSGVGPAQAGGHPCLLLVRSQDWSPTRACGPEAFLYLDGRIATFSVSSGSPVLNGGAYGTQKGSWSGVAMVGMRARWKGIWNGWLSLWRKELSLGDRD